jgi:hypothetical protein
MVCHVRYTRVARGCVLLVSSAPRRENLMHQGKQECHLWHYRLLIDVTISLQLFLRAVSLSTGCNAF